MTQQAYNEARTAMDQTHTTTSTKTESVQKGGFFDGISMAQVGAGTLAAVTSMLLSSQIGVTGSVIGVAVGAFVSTLCTQVYKMFLSRSADKLRNLRSDGSDDATMVQQPVAQASEQDDLQQTQQMNSPYSTAGYGAVSAATTRANHAHAAYSADATHPVAQHTPRLGSDARVSDSALSQHAARKRKAKVQRGVIVVAVVSALVAVGISAAVINFATAGEGVGVKTGAVVATDTSTTSTATPADATTDSAATSMSRDTGTAASTGTKSSTATGSSNTASDSTKSATASGTSSSTTGSATTGTSSTTKNETTSTSSTTTGTSNGAGSTGSTGSSTTSGTTTASTTNGTTNAGTSD